MKNYKYLCRDRNAWDDCNLYEWLERQEGKCDEIECPLTEDIITADYYRFIAMLNKI